MTTTITATPLPALNSPRIQELRLIDRPCYCCTYATILRAEQHATEQEGEEDIISARVAGYFLLEFIAQSEFFGENPCTSIISIITETPLYSGKNEHDVVFEFGELCRDKLLRLFWTSSTPYPPSSSHTSHSSFDSLEDAIQPTDSGYQDSERKALARDGYRCTITGMFDEMSLKNYPTLQDIAERDGANEVSLQICHILSESTMQGIQPAGISGTHHAAGAMGILETFGLNKFSNAFKKPGGVYRPWNLLTLEPNLHNKFDHLELWFEHIRRPNRYKVCVLRKRDESYIRRAFVGPEDHIEGAPMVVEFNSGYEHAPPPDPYLLALHATCARVAHITGAAQFFDKLGRDAEETKVLAFDGSSARLLRNLISPFALIKPGCDRADWDHHESSPLATPEA